MNYEPILMIICISLAIAIGKASYHMSRVYAWRDYRGLVGSVHFLMDFFQSMIRSYVLTVVSLVTLYSWWVWI